MEGNIQHSSSARPESSRSSTWPAPSTASVPHIKITSDDTPLHSVKPHQDLQLFEDQLDQHPEQHFLSPVSMYEYHDWASSSDSDDDDDDDDDEVEWNAGITDFALFDRDRRRARDEGQAIPEKWQNLLESQASSLGRAIERSRQSSHVEFSTSPASDGMPDLTPDGSPQLCDDLDVGSWHGQTVPRPVIPEYLRSVTSSPSICITGTRSDELAHSAHPRRTQSTSHIERSARPTRPGLRDGRTLSGKQHVWRRPSWDIFTVKEDVAAESRAEAPSTAIASSQEKAVVADFQLALRR